MNPDNNEPSSDRDDVLAAAIVRAYRAKIPPDTSIQTDGLSIAILAVGLAAVAAWRPDVIPVWLCLVPAAVHTVSHAALAIFEFRLAREAPARWRHSRGGGGA